MKRPMRRPEQVFHQSVAELFGYVLTKEMVWWHTPNGGARSKTEAGILKSMGVKAGVPDFVIIYRGHAYFIELKTAKTKTSLVQDNMIADLRNAGSTVRVCSDMEQIYQVLKDWFKLEIR